MTPTHSSNMDSVVLGWSLQRAALPPVTYGAGTYLTHVAVQRALKAIAASQTVVEPPCMIPIKTYKVEVADDTVFIEA